MAEPSNTTIEPCRLLALPRELRDRIWEYLVPTGQLQVIATCTSTPNGDLEWSLFKWKPRMELRERQYRTKYLDCRPQARLRQTCKQANEEMGEIFIKFVDIRLLSTLVTCGRPKRTSRLLPTQILDNARQVTILTDFSVPALHRCGRRGKSVIHAEAKIDLKATDTKQLVTWSPKREDKWEPIYDELPKAFFKPLIEVSESLLRDGLAEGWETSEVWRMALMCMWPGMWLRPHNTRRKEYDSSKELDCDRAMARDNLQWLHGLLKDSGKIAEEDRKPGAAWQFVDAHPSRMRTFCSKMYEGEKGKQKSSTKLNVRGPRRSHLRLLS